MHQVNDKSQSRTLTLLVVVLVSHEGKRDASVEQSFVNRKKNKGEGRLILCDCIDYLCPSQLAQGQTFPYHFIVVVLLGTAVVSPSTALAHSGGGTSCGLLSVGLTGICGHSGVDDVSFMDIIVFATCCWSRRLVLAVSDLEVKL